jgi:hypothetical protein
MKKIYLLLNWFLLFLFVKKKKKNPVIAGLVNNGYQTTYMFCDPLVLFPKHHATVFYHGTTSKLLIYIYMIQQTHLSRSTCKMATPSPVYNISCGWVLIFKLCVHNTLPVVCNMCIMYWKFHLTSLTYYLPLRSWSFHRRKLPRRKKKS